MVKNPKGVGRCKKWSKRGPGGKRRCLKRDKSTRGKASKAKTKCLKWAKKKGPGGRKRCLKRAKS